MSLFKKIFKQNPKSGNQQSIDKEPPIREISAAEVTAGKSSIEDLFSNPRVWNAFKEAAKNERHNPELFEFYELFVRFRDSPFEKEKKLKEIYDYLYQDPTAPAVNLPDNLSQEIKKANKTHPFNEKLAKEVLEKAVTHTNELIENNNLADYPEKLSLRELNQYFQKSDYYQQQLKEDKKSTNTPIP